jgi:predicted transcriptional regulator
MSPRLKPITNQTMVISQMLSLIHSITFSGYHGLVTQRVYKVWVTCAEGQQTLVFAALEQRACKELLRRGLSRIVGGMEVRFSPAVESRLQQVGSANGKDVEQLVKDIVARMLENQARFIAGVQRGIEQANRGEFVEHIDVLNRIDRLFYS